MTDADKKRLAIGAAIVVALIVFYFLLNKGNVIQRIAGAVGDNYFGAPEMGGFNFGDRGGFVVPDFGYNPETLSAIGACCTDCGSTARQNRTSYAPASSGPTLIYNAGANGPNVYNYYAPTPVVQTTRPVLRVWSSSR